MKRLLTLALLSCLPLAVSCEKKQGEQPSAAVPPAAPGEVHAISMPRYQLNLPEGPGREVFATSCLSCHSTRYITMQPNFSAAQWEATVQKMIKTYGAPVAEEQVPQIVEYIMSAKEGGNGRAWNNLVTTPAGGEAAAILPVRDPVARAEDAQRGANLFAANCATCHGQDGAGDGPAGLALLPRPANFTATRLAPETISAALHGGVPATAMISFAALPPNDLRALVTYVHTLGPRRAKVKVQAETKALYMQNCAACHGADGQADGIAAATLPRPPANFKFKQPSAEFAAQVIADGIPGTTMPQWKAKLSEEQRKQLAEYVRSFYEGYKTGIQHGGTENTEKKRMYFFSVFSVPPC